MLKYTLILIYLLQFASQGFASSEERQNALEIEHASAIPSVAYTSSIATCCKLAQTDNRFTKSLKNTIPTAQIDFSNQQINLNQIQLTSDLLPAYLVSANLIYAEIMMNNHFLNKAWNPAQSTHLPFPKSNDAYLPDNPIDFIIKEKTNRLLIDTIPLLVYNTKDIDQNDVIDIGFIIHDTKKHRKNTGAAFQVQLANKTIYAINIFGDELINFTSPELIANSTSGYTPSSRTLLPDMEARFSVKGLIDYSSHEEKLIIHSAINMANIQEANHISLNNGEIILDVQSKNNKDQPESVSKLKNLSKRIRNYIKPIPADHALQFKWVHIKEHA